MKMTKKTFVRKDAHKKARISNTWRKPKGIQNKKRLNRKNHGINVRPGYCSPVSSRGKHKTGLEIVPVISIESLKSIDPKTQGVLILKTGKKTKMEIIKEAEKLKIQILNLDVAKYKESVEKFLADRKDTATKREKKEAQKKKESLDEKVDNKKDEPELSAEEKKKLEKEEKDKILTKGNSK